MFLPLICFFTMHSTDTFISSSGGRCRQAAGFKRRKKASSASSSAPHKKIQRLTTDSSPSETTTSRSNHQRRGIPRRKTARIASSDGRGKGRKTEAGTKPIVRFADKRKRTLKLGKRFTASTRGGGRRDGVKKRSGGLAFRRRAKAAS